MQADRSKLEAYEIRFLRRMEKMSLVDNKINQEIQNVVQEDGNILNKMQYGTININGWVMCYSMMDCCMIYWTAGCRGKEQEVGLGCAGFNFPPNTLHVISETGFL